MYYCGIDIAKQSHSISILDETGTIIKKGVQVKNDRQGFEEMKNLLSPYRGEIKIGLEATGHYWLALYECLSQQEYTFWTRKGRTNPICCQPISGCIFPDQSNSY